MEKKLTQITSKLISIPSWLDKNTNEARLADFIFNYIKGLKRYRVFKQKVEGKRANIIVKDSYPTKLLIIGHIDTVQPNQTWKTNPTKPILRGNKLYGLGSSDMKCGIASMLYALEKNNNTKGLMMLFYVDEEYDFAGSKKFIDEYKQKIKPNLILSTDGSELSIKNCCRGITEIQIEIRGKGGHPANPLTTPNPINEYLILIKKLKSYLSKSDNKYGKTTLNVPFIQSGNRTQGNVIPSNLFSTLEIRTANKNITPELILSKINNYLPKQLSLPKKDIRFSLSSWITPQDKLNKLEKVVRKVTDKDPFNKINPFSSYYDIAMFSESLRCPCASIGAGSKNQAHNTNEYVQIPNICKLTEILTGTINTYC